MTPGRASVVDFTLPFYVEPTSVLVPPPGQGSKLLAVIRPLPAEVSHGAYFQNKHSSLLLIILFISLLYFIYLSFLRRSGSPQSQS